MTDAIQLQRCEGCQQKNSDCPICDKGAICTFTQTFKDPRTGDVFAVKRKKYNYTICRWDGGRRQWVNAKLTERRSFDAAQNALNEWAKDRGWTLCSGPSR